MSDTHPPAPWRPYENAGIFRHLVAAREAVLAPLNRRYFILPALNPHGVTVGEVLLLVVLVGALVPLAVVQRRDMAGTGIVAAVLLTATAGMATRRLNVVSLLLSVPYESIIRWHFVLSVAALAYGVVHTLVAFAEHGWRWSGGAHDHSRHNLMGTVSLGALALTVVSSARPVRRLVYRWWKYSHVLLSLVCLAFAELHQPPYGATGMALLAADHLITHVVQACVLHSCISANSTVVALPADVVRISFPRGRFRYKAGQYMMVCVPRLSILEWHPFSISSAPNEEIVSIHVRALGDWTRRLQMLATYRELQDRKVWVLFHGPYGEASVDIEGPSYKVFLLVSGGVGITPMQSIFKSMVDQAMRKRTALRRVLFVWAVRDTFVVDSLYDKEQAERLPRELPVSFQPSDISEALKQAEMLESIVDPENVRLAAVFQTEFYLTKPRPETDYSEANIRPSGMPNLTLARPDIASILERMARTAEEFGESKVAVLTCCPPLLTQAVREACVAAASSSRVRFDLHVEQFQW